MVRPSARFAQAIRPRRFPQQNAAPRRFASNTPGSSTEGAQKKAEDALATAQKYAGEAVAVGKKFLGPVGEKLGNALGCTSPLCIAGLVGISVSDVTCSLLV